MKSISLAFAGVCSLLAASSVLAAPSGFPKQAIVSAVNEAQLNRARRQHTSRGECGQ